MIALDLDRMDTTGETGCGPLLFFEDDAPRPLRTRILEYIRARGTVSRADIAKALSVSPGSVTTITAELIATGLIEECEGATRDSSRGRPPVALRLIPSAQYVVGMKLSDSMHSAIVSDFSGRILGEAMLRSAREVLGITETLAEAERLYQMVLGEADLSRDKISVIGVGLPGLVEHETGNVLWSPIIRDGQHTFGQMLVDRLGAEVVVDNDANMVTLAELWFGAGRTQSDFAVVTIEHGVGMGLVLSNRLFRGSMGLGLELGHTKVQLDGALCRCGQRGCLEAYVADYALVREATTAMKWTNETAEQPHVVLESLYDQAKAGNEAARSIFRRAGRFLAVGLANISQLFDPKQIILSGERMKYDLLYTEEVLSEMNNLSLNAGRVPPRVDIHAWGDLVWARGASALALTRATELALNEASI